MTTFQLLQKLLLVFICVCIHKHAESKKPKELEIITQFKPEDCYESADNGDEVHVQYTGKLETGQIFDTSLQEGRGPLPFTLGQGKVIPGWEQGIRGMCVGEKRKLVIPPHLAYGSKGVPPTIPPDATLHFETELVQLDKPGAEWDVMGMIQFLAFPAGLVLIVYYVYDKYTKAPTKKEIREERKSMRNSRKKKH